MRKINICFFSGDITRSGGTERVAALIANELNKDNNYNISFVSLTERREEPFFSLDAGIDRYKLYDKVTRGATHILGYIHRLKNLVKKYNIEILVDIDGIIDMYSIPVKWMTRVKVISWEHFNLYNHPNQKLREKVRRFAVKYLDAIVTLTEQDRDCYLSELSFKCPIQAIYNPVTYTGIDNKYNEQSKIIMSVGRLTYQKGFDRLVEIAELVLNKHADWKWLIFGEGEDRETLEQMIVTKGLSDNLKLMGNVNDIDYRYNESAMFVMTSRFEGLPMTLLEAKYYKLPIISFDIKTGPKECIIEGVNGYLVEENDNQTMAYRINNLIEDAEKRISFSEHALEDTEKFETQKIVKQWKELFNIVI